MTHEILDETPILDTHLNLIIPGYLLVVTGNHLYSLVITRSHS
jgi:hypothetical protein